MSKKLKDIDTNEMVFLVLRKRLEDLRAASDMHWPARSIKDIQEFVKEAMPLFIEMRAILREYENEKEEK